MEIHGMTTQEINHEFEEDHNDDDANQKDIDSEEETDLESSDSENESIYDDQCSTSQLQCNYCGKEFSVQRYLDAHLKDNHNQKQSFKCDKCEESFKQTYGNCSWSS